MKKERENYILSINNQSTIPVKLSRLVEHHFISSPGSIIKIRKQFMLF